MKVFIWISPKDLKNLNRALKGETIEDRIEFEYHEILIGEVQVSIDYEDYIRLRDNNLIWSDQDEDDF